MVYSSSGPNIPLHLKTERTVVDLFREMVNNKGFWDTRREHITMSQLVNTIQQQCRLENALRSSDPTTNILKSRLGEMVSLNVYNPGETRCGS